MPPGADVESNSLSPADRLLASCFRTRFAGGQLLALTSTARLFVYGPYKVAEIGDPAIVLEPPRGSRKDSGQKWPERLCSSETSLPTPRFSRTRTHLDARGLDYSRRPAGFCIYIPTLGSVDLAISRSAKLLALARACFARIASLL